MNYCISSLFRQSSSRLPNRNIFEIVSKVFHRSLSHCQCPQSVEHFEHFCTFGGLTRKCYHVNNTSKLKSVNVVQYRGIRISTSLAQTEKDEQEDEGLGKGDKVLRVKLSSTRVDAILKAGLSMSRNKIEKALYEDRVRLNGERLKKKSQNVEEGDEVDIVRGYNKLNPNSFIDVSRVEIVELGNEDQGSDDESDSDDEKQSKIPAVLRRSKLLTIKNYRPPWKGSTPSD